MSFTSRMTCRRTPLTTLSVAPGAIGNARAVECAGAST